MSCGKFITTFGRKTVKADTNIMFLYLEVINGKYAASTVALEAGDVCRIGHGATAEMFLPDNFALGENHFLLGFDGFAGTLIDLGSETGTFRDGEKVLAVEIQSSCRITAGETEFAVLLDDEIENHAIDTPIKRFAGYLDAQEDTLFCLVDAARDKKILPLLQNSGAFYQSLYQGEAQTQLASVAPYLVRFNQGDVFLERLLRHGWGKRWLTFFTSADAFENLRRHFRKFIFVKDERGEIMYFRFYDPSILRTFLPACTAAELKQYFGGIGFFFLEQELPTSISKFHFNDDNFRLNQNETTEIFIETHVL